jgi:O-succinylhomoserine sulfhydrylase
MSLHPVSKMIRTRVEQTNEMEHSSPLFLTSSFSFDSAEEMRAAFADETDDNIYTRFSNPTVQEFTDRMCVLEGMESGFATASGMSAVFASMLTFLKKGDHLLSCNAIFGSTHTVITKILPRYGIEFTYVSASDPASWEAAIRQNTKMIYLSHRSGNRWKDGKKTWPDLLCRQLLCDAHRSASGLIWSRPGRTFGNQVA